MSRTKRKDMMTGLIKRMRRRSFERLCIFIICLLSIGGKANAGSWELVETNTKTNVTLENLHFVDPQRGYAVSFRDTIFLTNDGGKTWIAQPIPISSVTTMHCLDAQHCWAASGTQKILRYKGDP